MTQVESTIELAGSPVVLMYSGVETEYEALRRRAIVVNRNHRGRMLFTGEKAADVLTGLVTNDVNALLVGQGQYAVALTAKGKIVSDVRILRLDEGFLTDASPRSRDGWTGIVRKYVNPRLAKYTDVTESWSSLGIYGTQARYVVEEMTGLGHSALALLLPYAHVSIERDGVRIIVMRSPDLAVEGYDLFVPAEKFQDLWDASVKAHATPGGHAVWEIARVEAGRPEFGVDMNDTTIPQEANLEQLDAISFTKGCYTGQEVVARVHFRGHVNRSLRGIRAAGTMPPPPHASLFDATGKAVGDVRSSVISPQLGGIALGMVRLEVEAGAELMARWSADIAGDSPTGQMAVNVVPLPFATT